MIRKIFALGLAAACAGAWVVPGEAAADVKIQRGNFSTAALLRDGGRVDDPLFRTLGYIRPEGRVEDNRFRTIGYLRADGRVEDDRFQTIGFVRADGEIEDASFRTVGYVREGVILDPEFRAVGYYEGAGDDGDATRTVAAYLFFFSTLLFEQPDWEVVTEP